MSPVFLFYVSIVIFVVGSRASKLDGAFSLCKVFQEVVIQEFGSVVGIEAEEGEGQ